MTSLDRRPSLASTSRAVQGVHEWTAAELEIAVRGVAAELGFGESAGKLFQPLRVALTGSAASPGLFDVIELLGRERTIKRLNLALDRLSVGSP